MPTAAFETAWFLLLCTSQLLIFNSWLRSEVSYMFQRPGGLWAIVSYRFVPWVPGPINRVALDSGLGIYLLLSFHPFIPCCSFQIRPPKSCVLSRCSQSLSCLSLFSSVPGVTTETQQLLNFLIWLISVLLIRVFYLRLEWIRFGFSHHFCDVVLGTLDQKCDVR